MIYSLNRRHDTFLVMIVDVDCSAGAPREEQKGGRLDHDAARGLADA